MKPDPTLARHYGQRGLALAAVILLLDQITKAWILYGINLPGCPPGEFSHLRACGGRHIELIPPFLNDHATLALSMVWNKGVSFGMLGWGGPVWTTILSLLALTVAVLFGRWMFQIGRLYPALCLGAIIGGAIGNVIDRVRFGAVADFINVSGLYFPWVFNVADASLSIGVALLALEFFYFEPRRERRMGKQA